MTPLCDCGCCEGITVETPAAVSNRPGLSAIAYRAGTHAQFKASMLARLSAADLPQLGRLKTRDDDDFTIALLDAWAVSADILTFYQERIANESYLRTATERQSVIELARLIGYELRPGVAATTHLAFMLETSVGSPPSVTLDAGTRVQSVPGPGEKPQTFETLDALVARPEWNVLKPRQSVVTKPTVNDTAMLLAGVTTNLKNGDGLLFVDGKNTPELRRISAVESDTASSTTTVRWAGALEKVTNADAFALRLRASIFGFNAPDWHSLPVALRFGEMNADPSDKTFKAGAFAGMENSWADANLARPSGDKEPWPRLNLDAVYSQVLPERWLVLSSNANTKAFTITAVAEEAVARFNVTGKSTRVTLSGTGIELFSPRNATVFIQTDSGPLDLAATPVTTKVTGTELVLDSLVTDMEKGRTILVADASDATKAEPVVVETSAASGDGKRTVLTLKDSGLKQQYPPATTLVYANVVLSSNGETVANEILGSGDAGEPYQHFTLKQAPLTYTPADTASGGESTLQVRVNDLAWSEVPTLYGHGPRERIYVTKIDDGGVATVQFGDGHTGARVPMGNENVTATYRKGTGLAGLVRAGQLTLLMTRPLGLRSVTNPMAAAGAQDPQVIDDARANAPVTVLTLDRIVSLQDYQDYARAFSGIAKALATWTWSGHRQQVFVTVAGIDGAAVGDGSTLQKSLLSSMQNAGDAFVPISIKTYRKATFKVVASVKVKPAYVPDTVLAAVEAALQASFSFDARSFGQPVTLSEVITVMQDTDGVAAVDVTQLHRSDKPETRETFLPSDAPQVGAGPGTLAAELLTLDPDGVELTEMP